MSVIGSLYNIVMTKSMERMDRRLFSEDTCRANSYTVECILRLKVSGDSIIKSTEDSVFRADQKHQRCLFGTALGELYS